MRDDYDLHLSNGSDDDDDSSLNVDVEANKPMSDAGVLYHASMLLKKTISSIQGLQIPQPPVASDITMENVQKIVTPTLFNFLALTLGFSDEAQIDSYVVVTDKQKSRIFSLVQDMIFISFSF